MLATREKGNLMNKPRSREPAKRKPTQEEGEMEARYKELSAKLERCEAERALLHEQVIALTAKMDFMAPLFERLMDAKLAQPGIEAAPKPADSDAVDPSAPLHQDTLRRIHNMTVKQRAVLFGVITGSSYQEVADAMRVDITTVKLHMRAALNKLGLEQKSSLMMQAAMLRELIAKSGGSDDLAFGISLEWMAKGGASKIEALRPTRKVLPPPGGGNAKKR